MSREVQVGDRLVKLEDFSGRKGARCLRVLDHIAKGFPEIQRAWQEYTAEYEATHTVDLDRAMARAEYAPRPMFRQEPVLDEKGQAVVGPDGEPLVRQEPQMADGRVLLGPDPLGHLTEADWEASGQKLRQPKSPSGVEQVAAIFPLALDLAEDEVAKLLALVAMPNEEVKRLSRQDGKVLWDELSRQGDDLLDAPFDQLIELAVAAGECVGEQYQSKVRSRLGERMTSVLNLVGLGNLASKIPEAPGTTSTEPASTTSPTSSTVSPPPTDGEKDEPSTEPRGAASAASSTG